MEAGRSFHNQRFFGDGGGGGGGGAGGGGRGD